MNKLTSIFKPLSRMFTYGPRPRPTRDWLVMLSIFFVTMLVSVAWNVWQFSRVVEGQKIGNEKATVSDSIPLTKVQTLFEARAQERAKYQGEYRFVDPSR